MELLYGPAIPTEVKSVLRRDTCTLTLTVAMFTISERRNQPTCPSTEKSIRKTQYTQQIPPCLKMKAGLLFATQQIHPEGILLSEIPSHDRTSVWSFRELNTQGWIVKLATGAQCGRDWDRQHSG